MLNTGGCGRLSPGIGDISYVKDLQTEEIVTTKFRCSQFSSYHSKSDGFGWVSFFRPQNISYGNLVPSQLYSKFELRNSELNAILQNYMKLNLL